MSRAATEPSNGFLVAPIRECSTRERSSLSAASALSTCAAAKYRAASISTIRVQSCARSECCQLLQPTLSDAESNECCALGENLDSGARKFEPKGTRGAQGNPKPQRRILIPGVGGWWESVGRGWRDGSTCGLCVPPLRGWPWEERLT